MPEQPAPEQPAPEQPAPEEPARDTVKASETGKADHDAAGSRCLEKELRSLDKRRAERVAGLLETLDLNCEDLLRALDHLVVGHGLKFKV